VERYSGTKRSRLAIYEQAPAPRLEHHVVGSGQDDEGVVAMAAALEGLPPALAVLREGHA
jgi:hypothetical protein